MRGCKQLTVHADADRSDGGEGEITSGSIWKVAQGGNTLVTLGWKKPEDKKPATAAPETPAQKPATDPPAADQTKGKADDAVKGKDKGDDDAIPPAAPIEVSPKPYVGTGTPKGASPPRTTAWSRGRST